MRTFVRVLAVLLLVAVAIGIGTAIYNQGVTAGLDEAARMAAASGDPTPVDPSGYRYGYGWDGPYAHGPFGWGFGIFGLLFAVFFVVLIVGLARAAFGDWRRPGPGGWGGRHDRIEEMHRELHRRDRTDAGGAAPA